MAKMSIYKSRQTSKSNDFFQEHFHGIRPVDEIPLNDTNLSSRTIEVIWTHDMENASPIIEGENIDDNSNDLSHSETLSEHDTTSFDNPASPRSNELFSEESDDDTPDLVLESSSENKQINLTNGNNEQQEVRKSIASNN